MKYTIEGFSQEYAITLRKYVERNGKQTEIKIDCTDLVILRWFVDFYPKMKKMIIDGKEYAWLSHKKLVEDLPLIDISKRAFIERIQKLVEFNVLEYKLIKENGTFSLYTFGSNYNGLINSNGMQSNVYGVCNQSYTGVYGQKHTKDNIINNISINNKENILKETFSGQDVELSEPTLFDLAEEPDFNSIQGDLLKLLESQSEDANFNTLNSLCNETQTAVVELTEQNNGIKIKNILNKKKTINEKLMAKIVDIKLFAFFKVFYKEYPRHIARANAWKTFRLKFMDNTYGEMNARFETIMKFLAVYKNNVSDKDTQYIKHPASWLNSEFL